MEKNKLATIYMEMRQEADIRNSLCDKYKLDPEVMKNKKTRAQQKVEDEIQALEAALQLKSERLASSTRFIRSNSGSSPDSTSIDIQSSKEI